MIRLKPSVSNGVSFFFSMRLTTMAAIPPCTFPSCPVRLTEREMQTFAGRSRKTACTSACTVQPSFTKSARCSRSKLHRSMRTLFPSFKASAAAFKHCILVPALPFPIVSYTTTSTHNKMLSRFLQFHSINMALNMKAKEKMLPSFAFSNCILDKDTHTHKILSHLLDFRLKNTTLNMQAK